MSRLLPAVSALLALAIYSIPPVATAQTTRPGELRGKIDAITVYRGQALVTRLVEVPGPGGLREVVVTDLPHSVIPGSLYAESADGVEVRSVRYRERPVAQDVREEVRQLDEQIRGVQDQLATNQRSAQVLEEQKQYLAKLEQFTAPTAQVELSKGILNAETLKSLTLFQFEQRQQLAENQLKLAREQRDLNEKMALLQRQRAELTGGSARTVREAVIFANLPAAGGKLRVRYVVSNATWMPSYNVRAERGGAAPDAGAAPQRVTLEYNASVQQTSGEDWTDVQMTLSTATPSLVAMAPALDPLDIALAPVASQQGRAQVAQREYLSGKLELKQRRDEIDVLRQNAYHDPAPANAPGSQPGGTPDASFDKRLNQVAGEMQVLELFASGARDRDGPDGRGAVGDESVSVTYQLPARTSLPSRQDLQLIQIATMPLKAEPFKLAIPVLTSYVYDQATVTNESRMVLLAGPVASYAAGQFVGRGQIPTIAIGETFSVGFGIDTSLRATRELLDKTEVAQGGNKVATFNYRLAVENFGQSAARVRVVDRLPTSKDNDLKITFVSSTKDVSGDETYQQTERKKSILRWELEVPPQAIGPKAASLDYQYRLEYDKQMTIAGLGTK